MTKLIDGITLMHEHVKIDLSRYKNDDAKLDLFDETVKEFKDLYKYGVRNILDLTNIGMGRDIEYMEKVKEETGINIIYSTGFYKEPFLPEYVKDKSIDELRDIAIKEIKEGIDNTNIKASCIGEIGTSKDEFKALEKKVFKAMGLAQLETNVPISTHTSLGSLGKEQIQLFKSMGLNLNKIIIGHSDLSKDISYILDLLESGVYVGFDTIGKNKYAADSFRIDSLKEIKNRGYLDKVVLSMDITRKSHLKVNGGLGYSYIFTDFIPSLLKNSFTNDDIDTLLVNNPKNIFNS